MQVTGSAEINPEPVPWAVSDKPIQTNSMISTIKHYRVRRDERLFLHVL
jgi:hypothetical protein